MERQTMSVLRLALGLLALVTAMLTGSCSGQKRAEVAILNPLLEELAALRGMPATAPLGPNQHYRVTGEITFHMPDQDIKLPSELWLAGPERMRFQLGQSPKFNIFSLYDPDHCWLKAEQREVVDYDATELLTETALRWEVLRFPWGWDEQLLLIRAAADSEPVGLALKLMRPTPLGELTIELDDVGLPKYAALGESAVNLSEWNRLKEQSTLIPLQWLWQHQAGKRTETIVEFGEAALFHDRAFRPVTAGGTPVGQLQSALEDERTIGDEFGMLGKSFRFLEEESASAQVADLPAGEWWQAGEQRFFILRHPDPEVTAKWPSSESVSKQWLRWSTYSKVSMEDGIASLRSVMSQTGYRATGQCWALIVADDGRARRSIFLMPVEKDE
ncbi:MAG: hypothetical protein QF489_03400 [Planctomycetota bacterium]|jgi:hypothetical protein|nr:hypothetical protein [Planctomycetota bacterium]